MVHPRAQKGDPSYRSTFKASAYITSTSLLLAGQVRLKAIVMRWKNIFFPQWKDTAKLYTIPGRKEMEQ